MSVGAKLIFGGEAMAVRPDGRANPHQLIINEANKAGLARLREILLSAHREIYGTADEPVIGFQLTHSGRFCRPIDKKRMEPRVAYRHPILDRTFKVTSDAQVWTDSELCVRSINEWAPAWERGGVRVVLCPSREDDAWQGVRGYVQEEARSLAFGGSSPGDSVAFVSGMHAMVDDVRAVLGRAGVPPARIHVNF